MEFPLGSEIEEALEWYLAAHGPCRPDEVYEPLADHFQLTTAQRTAQRDHRPEPIWHNKVCWARQRLKNRKRLARTERGVWDLARDGEVLPVSTEVGKPVEQVAA
jgi:restriction endonuclease Mrr